MQRTRAESSLQRSLELEDGAPPLAPSPSIGMGSGATPTTTASGASRYFNTPRGRLLQMLAAEAAAAHKELSLRETREGLPPSYSEVLGAVDAALLHSAGSSPSRIPRQASGHGGGAVDAAAAAMRPVAYRSPSRIPRPAALGLPPSPFAAGDENAGSVPASPDKEQPAAGVAGRFGQALSSSIENLRGFYHQ